MKAQQQVPRARDRVTPVTLASTGLLQRKCACGSGASGAGGECAECQKKRLDLRKREDSSGDITGIQPINHEALKSPGHPLDQTVRFFMEDHFGHDFSQVRVHTDARSGESARELGALAYTVGSDLVFADRQYSPSSVEGRKLIAHELTHVVQQRAGTKSAEQRSDEPAEREAEAVAQSIGNAGQSDQTQRGGAAVFQPGRGKPSGIKSIKVWMKSFISNNLPGQTLEIPDGPFKGRTMLKAPFSLITDCFTTDDRGFSNDLSSSARMHSEITVDLHDWPNFKLSTLKKTGTTHEIDCEDGEIECKAQASPNRMHIFPPLVHESRMIFPIQGAANDPCFSGAPDIDYQGLIQIDVASGEVAFEGKVDAFPSFEMYASANDGTGEPVFQVDPEPDSSPFSLSGPANRKVSGSLKL